MDAIDAEKGQGPQDQADRAGPGGRNNKSPAQPRSKRAGGGKSPPKKTNSPVRKSLEQVNEAEEFRETTPAGNRLKRAKK